MSYWADLTIIIFLILLNGLFAMSELAVVSSRKPRLKMLVEAGQRGAGAALLLAENPGRFLSTVQVGITLVGIFAGAFGGEKLAPPLAQYLSHIEVIAPFSSTVALLVVVAGITYASIVIGELAPKQLALKNAERFATAVAPFMTVLAVLTMPVVYILEVSAQGLLRLFGSGEMTEQKVTEEEVKAVIAEGVTTGALKPEEQEMMAGVMRLADWRVRTLMTPRQDIVWLNLEDSEPELRRVLRETHYSRLLVADGNLDNLLGIIQAKDIVNHIIDGQPLALRQLLCQPLYIRGNMSVLQVVELFRQTPIHLAVLRDEHSGVEGIVTAVDILSAIVGDLAEPGPDTEPEILQRDDGSWLIDGTVPMDVLKDQLKLKKLPAETDFHTIAGFMLWQLDRVPVAGDHFLWESFRFEVVDMDEQRIDKVLIIPPVTESSAKSEKLDKTGEYTKARPE